jgi:hypothetical protein
MKILNLVIISLIHLFPVTFQFQTVVNSPSDLLGYEVKNSYVGKVVHEVRIVNNSSSSVTGELFIPLIRNMTSRHFVILQNKTPPCTLIKDDSENIYINLNNITIAEDQTFRLKVSYHVLSFEVQYLINTNKGGDDASLFDSRYIVPEKLIESNDSRITSLAYNLTVNVSDFHEKVLEIYRFVHRYLQYKAQNEERGALWALEHETGDCSEYSYLFVALCRAAGIPARIQAGFAFHRSHGVIEDGHMWAEYHLTDYGWIPVDVTWQLFDYIDARHFSSIQSVPIITPYTNYLFECKEEDSILEEQTISLTPCETEIFTDDLVEIIMNAVREKNQAQQTLSLSRIFGIPLLFPSEVNEIEQTFLQARIHLHNAINAIVDDQETAISNAVIALERLELIKGNIWILVVKAFSLFIGVLLIIIVIGSYLIKFSKDKNEVPS